jgi:hypothetical protein
MIKLIDLLKEIGDASMQPADFWQEEYTEAGDYAVIEYGFKVGPEPDNQYMVTVDIEPVGDDVPEEGNTLEVDFKGPSGMNAVNKGYQYKVMSTVVAILRKVVEERKKKGKEITNITYTPIKRGNDEIDTGRESLYRAYVRKQLPDWNYSKYGDSIILSKDN